jgi:hypothetical protein
MSPMPSHISNDRALWRKGIVENHPANTVPNPGLHTFGF